MAAEEPVPPVGEKTWDAFLTAVATSLYNTIYTGASEPDNISSNVEVGESKHTIAATYTYPKFNSGNVPTIDAIKSNIIRSIGFDETMLSNSIIGEKTAVASIVTLIGHYIVDTFFPAYHKAGTSTSGVEVTTLGSFSWSMDKISAADMNTILNSMAAAVGDAMSGTVTQAVASATCSSCSSSSSSSCSTSSSSSSCSCSSTSSSSTSSSSSSSSCSSTSSSSSSCSCSSTSSSSCSSCSSCSSSWFIAYYTIG